MTIRRWVGRELRLSGSASIAQDWRNLSGERGLSTFDQRNVASIFLQYTTGMGMAGGSLMSGWKGRVYKEWTIQTQINVGSGLPETPTNPGVLTSAYAVARPDVTGAPLYAAPPGRFVNPAAFVEAPTGQWGNARRDAIIGPNQFSLNATMLRTFRMTPKLNLDVTIVGTNAVEPRHVYEFVYGHYEYAVWVAFGGESDAHFADYSAAEVLVCGFSQ